ncbi:hypothetical protein GCM10025876_31870 [Demequina litorisediminis]|uniref:Isoleucine--tRNA ligase n=1 Tax=Demequina litorisediminis TaxID=1849022 RepID=A0ABQ6IGJ9_9MICO|nr:DUF5915 domain-containing protein [Demequina litorisediminis]GMA36983.1 hypothetical protein GCM10025876_31870 [Demequina litorisediminis]
MRVVTAEDFTAAHPVEQRLAVNARAAGPRIGKDVQAAIKGAKTGDWSVTDGQVVSGGIALEEGEYELATVIGGSDDAADEAAAVLGSGGFVLLETALTPELEAEGYARDVIRVIQDTRKAEGLQVSDRIVLTLTVPADRVDAVTTWTEAHRGETLAVDPATGAARVTVSGDGDLAAVVSVAN